MNLKKRLSPFIGDKAFYKALMAIALPVILQNGLTMLVSLLDNIMVGAVGTEQMTGVSIANQLMFVFNLCVFGGMSGASIFGAQFFGKKDHEGVRHAFRFKLLLAGALVLLGVGIFSLFHDPLISMYLHEGGETGDIFATARYGREYLQIMLWGFLPFALMQAYASTLRECGETLLPMKAGITAILINLVLNYILIFGKLGLPAMGANGAAIATVISRYVECVIVVFWTHRNKEKMPFIQGAYQSMHIPKELTRQIFIKGMPLLINEALWSSGMAMLTQSYSTRGLAVVAGLNICSTISNLFNTVWMANGTAVAIMVGQQLGANQFDEAKRTMKRLLGFSVLSALATTLVLAVFAPLFPRFYNTTEEVRHIATGLLLIVAFAAPIHSFVHVSYFTLRSGGKTWITFLFDCAYMWVVSIPLARILANHTALAILPMYAICQYSDIIKAVLGAILLKKGVWIHNIVDDTKN